jgi:hypothetical protein
MKRNPAVKAKAFNREDLEGLAKIAKKLISIDVLETSEMSTLFFASFAAVLRALRG